ncbi:MAG: hypothetical protein A2173_00230 [Planctomycetes bacterium RBG_13_44_8b]|nr:MAG: hypothetical protein A2173_00230 [Planctomycetes bacterium RBG_13_44_8b]
MPANLNNKNINIKAVANKALKNDKLLAGLLDNLWSKDETIRYNSHKVLFFITEERPQALYSNWDYFVKFLDSDNTYHKLSAILLLANLTKVDKNNKFEKMFNRFYDLLNDKSFITAAYLAGASGKIAKAKPKLQTRITNRLLSIDKTHHDPERIDLVKGSIIESFKEYFEESKNKKKIIEFVKKQLKSKSPKTKKIAKDFIEQLNKSTEKEDNCKRSIERCQKQIRQAHRRQISA